MFASKDTLLTRPSGYNIARSVRLRSSASAYFSRTTTTPTSGSIFTHSFWVKRGTLGSLQTLISGARPTNFDRIYISATDTLFYQWNDGASNLVYLETTQVFRDPSAWYHIIVATDTTQATSTNRVKFYVNGVQVTAFASTTYPTQNSTSYLNVNAGTLNLGRTSTAVQYLDGYLTEINFIDGQALTPSSFGSTNAITGVWQPKAFSGTYGTNGFELNFSDNSNNTAATIGKDYSGNGNNWTPNNISVTAGATYDSMTDVPTLTSATAANYCVVDVLSPIGSASALSTVASANLQLTHSGSSYSQRFGNMVVSSGKWYFEFTLTNIGYPSLSVGVSKLSTYPTYNGAGGQATSCAAVGYFTGTDLNVCTEAGGTGAGSISSQTWSNGDIIMVAFSIDTGKIWWGKNGTWYSSGNPAADTNNITTITSGAQYRPWVVLYGTTTDTSLNFGQRPFSYTPPTGFVALNTYNLPASTITNGAAYMAATTYTGTGASLTVANTVGSTSFQPDWVWVKRRDGPQSHQLYDINRGVNQAVYSNLTSAEVTEANGLSAFTSSGFTVISDIGVNTSGGTYVGWQWKASNTTASNTNGSITSTVSVGATQGFSVVTYTGTGANATVGHGLGVAPQMIIVKCRSNASTNWTVYHTSLGNTGYIYLNLTNAAGTGYSGFWNSTSPTSSVFSLGSDVDGYVNGSGRTNVAYCVASVAGFSSVGSYTGNGSTDGPFIYLGFKPRWFMSKRSDTAGNDWVIMDTSRDTYNASQKQLYANSSIAEEVNSVYDRDFLSNGIKIRTSTASANASSSTYIYMAFAENPFRNALAR